jgi:septum formation protein
LPQLYLASSSPRRIELLQKLNLNFLVVEPHINEAIKQQEKPLTFVKRLAKEKAYAGLQLIAKNKIAPVLAADTIVVIDDQVLGKPSNQEEGIAMLDLLSGKTHKVYTAIAVLHEKIQVKVSVSKVTFRELSQQEKISYWQSGEPQDKAGSYAIQGLGAIFIKRLVGSYSGVMGLPLYETAELLREIGIQILHKEG